MGIFDWITGGGKVAEQVVGAAIKTGDALFFTDEEKSVANMKRLDWTLAYLKTTSGQNVARRMIAVGVVGLWVALILVACVFGYWDRSEGSYSMWVFDVIKDALNNPFMIIIGFYFMTSLARAVKTGG